MTRKTQFYLLPKLLTYAKLLLREEQALMNKAQSRHKRKIIYREVVAMTWIIQELEKLPSKYREKKMSSF